MSISPSTLAELQRTDDPAGLLWMLEITGAHLAEPVRVVADTRDVQSGGHTWLGIPFQVVPPRQADKEIPRSTILLDNVGRELTADLEALPPGGELMATIRVAHRRTPDVIDYAFTAPINGVQVNPLTVSSTLGVTDLWRRPAVALRFDPKTAPGLF